MFDVTISSKFYKVLHDSRNGWDVPVVVKNH